MQRLLERLSEMSVDRYSCRQDMEQDFHKIFGDLTFAGETTLSPDTTCYAF